MLISNNFSIKEISDGVKIIAFPILLALVGYFLNDFRNSVKESNDKLDKIGTEITTLQIQIKEATSANQANRGIINNHEVRLNSLETFRIEYYENKINELKNK